VRDSPRNRSPRSLDDDDLFGPEIGMGAPYWIGIAAKTNARAIALAFVARMTSPPVARISFLDL